MNIFRGIRERIGSVLGAVIASVCFLAIGAFLAFFVSPQQALEWRRVEGLPELDAGSYATIATGEEVAITGFLTDNETLTAEGLVAYTLERWSVDPPDDGDEDDEPSGSWTTVDVVVPALMIDVTGGTITTLPTDSVTFGGNLHYGPIAHGSGSWSANFEGQLLPDGSERTQGFINSDLITVVGHKASTGDLVPNRLFGGDRVQLVQDIRSGARAAFIAGIAMMICSPLVLVLGILGALFGRRKISS